MKGIINKFLHIVLLFSIIVSVIPTTIAYATTYEKQYCSATIQDNFVDDEILIITMPYANFVKYSIADFSNIGCTHLQELSYLITDNELCRIIKLTLNENSKQNVLNSIKLLEERSDIYSAEPNYIGSFSTFSQDPYYVNGEQWAIDKISLPNAWAVSSNYSQTILVGVIDSGIDASHPDLIGKVNTTLSKCFTSANINATTDTQGHGTHVAGIIGAKINNIGIAGVSPNVELVSLNVANELNTPDSAAIISAIIYASIHNIPILNCSIGWEEINYYEISSLRLAIEQYNGLLVCGAGNSGTDNNTYRNFPSDTNYFPNVISVGASNENDQKWTYSNYGATSVDLFAPGEDILSTFPANICSSYSHIAADCYCQGYHKLDGTSMASPYVAGVAALMLSANPNLQAYQIKDIILRSVDIIDAFKNLCSSGGRLNAYKAVNTARMLYLNCETTYTAIPSTNGLTSPYHNVHYDICSECSCNTYNGECTNCGICDPCENCHISYTELHNYRVIDYGATQHTLHCDDCDTTTTNIHELYVLYEEENQIIVKCKWCSYTKYCESYSYSSQNHNSHIVNCYGCGYSIQEPHQFDSEKKDNDDIYHYNTCIDCEYKYLVPHNWGIIYTGNGTIQICKECSKQLGQ